MTNDEKLRKILGEKDDLKVVMESDIPSTSQIILDFNGWTRSFSKSVLFMAIGLTLAVVVLVVALAVISSYPPTVLGYAIDNDGRYVELRPIDEPTVTDAELLKWAGKKITQLHNINFVDYIDHIDSLESDFSPEAFTNWQQSLLDSDLLDKVRRDRLSSWAEPISAPRIIDAAAVNGRYTWVVEMDITEYIGGGGFSTTGTNLNTVIFIERTERSNNLAGIRIKKYLAKEGL